LIFDPAKYDKVAAMTEGSLEKTPFAGLLYSLARAETSGVLTIQRPPLYKEIYFENGAPIDARSNLVTETLSRFMVSAGWVDQTTSDTCFKEACSRGVRFGDILIEKHLITAEELLKVLQQNLAHKLLDGFSWREGNFEIRHGEVETDSSLKVNVAQLIVIGLTRFASQQQIDASIAPLIGRQLIVNPEPFYGLDVLKLNSNQQPLVDALNQKAHRIDELASASGMTYEDLTRLLFALSLIGLIIPSEKVPTLAKPKPPQRAAVTPGEKVAVAQAESPADQRDELMQLLLNYRRQGASELLGLEADGGSDQAGAAFLTFAERYAPWKYDESLRDRVGELFLAGARAYNILASRVQHAPKTPREEIRPRPDTPAKQQIAQSFRIETELLDPEVQFVKGRKLMAQGAYDQALSQLEYASNLDPQNTTYRAELAYCRFQTAPETSSKQALANLKDTLRIDPRCGLALFYAGEILREVGRFDEAESYLKKSIKPMAPDRRPIEALRLLTTEKKNKK
jgi:Flp pilus assembly protein TadD